ncbi:hypothetical protein FGG08_003134 [Glutinoglossum americanum]|uniref:Uncharacterized protein n=1 Tax=Glutinoglossum americanum TaxID=1670608 RepID=A0A9P8KYG5_9PEZI|nr:hypothetical protein FGG08_003134 [Glutinoglossum americanum]
MCIFFNIKIKEDHDTDTPPDYQTTEERSPNVRMTEGFQKAFSRFIDHCLKLERFKAGDEKDAEIEKQIIHRIADRALNFRGRKWSSPGKEVEEQVVVERTGGVEG